MAKTWRGRGTGHRSRASSSGPVRVGDAGGPGHERGPVVEGRHRVGAEAAVAGGGDVDDAVVEDEDETAVEVGELHGFSCSRAGARSAEQVGGAGARRRRCRRGGSRVAAGPSARRGAANQAARSSAVPATSTTAPPMEPNQSTSAGSRSPAAGSSVTRRHPAPWTSSNHRPSRFACGNSSPGERRARRATRPAGEPGQPGHLGHLAGDGRGHRLVARRGLGRVGDADDLAELDREVDRGDRARAAAPPRRSRAASGAARPVEDEVELPREVGRVADPGAHALAGERRHQVRGVAGEEDPPVLPPLGDPGLERVDGVPFDAGVARVHVPRRRAASTRVASWPSSSSVSSGRRMNSQRRRPGPPDTAVVGRAGSQIWRLIGSNTRGSSRMTSTISQS